MSEKEKTKPTKKKIAMYYLSLAACLLIIASITVGVIFALKGKNDNVIDNKPPVEDNNPNSPSDEGNGDNNGDNNGGDDSTIDTSTSYKFIVPISADLSKEYSFCYDETLDRYSMHTGMDFSAPAGTQVFAAVDGTVTEISERSVLYGAVITIKHENDITTVYKFVDPVEGLSVGQRVNRGDVIATVATATGVENKQGDHLHFEVTEKGVVKNPDDYLLIGSK